MFFNVLTYLIFANLGNLCANHASNLLICTKNMQSFQMC